MMVNSEFTGLQEQMVVMVFRDAGFNITDLCDW